MKGCKWISIFTAGFLLLLASCSSSPAEKENVMRREFFAMNTYNTITVYDNIPEGILKGAEQDLKKMEALWSVTDENSEIYSINHADGMPVEVEDMTADLLQFALTMSRQTDGALDMTLYPVLTAWGFTTGSHQVPSDETLAQKMRLVGYDKVSLSGSTVTLRPGMEIDLGAVAKGYACDIITNNLKANGVTSGIVSLGGNIQVIGKKPDGSDWQISIEHPQNGDSLGMLSAANASVVTSGAYERYFTGEDGKRYGHILDPATGQPAQSGLASVTVVGQEGKLCDALATAFFVMGLEKTQVYLEEHSGIEALIMTEQGEIYLTAGLKDKFTLNQPYQHIPVYALKP